jgi:long-chain alkane monooxygenase
LAYVVMPETYRDIVNLLIPELQRRGAYKKEYRPGTLREKLFRQGPYLPETHPGNRHTLSSSDSQPRRNS